MREIRSSGSAEGVMSNHDPYSDSFGSASHGCDGEWTHDYSVLSACMGWIDAARRAGASPENNAVKSRRAAAAP